MNNINVTDHEKELVIKIILNILPTAHIYVFGSRISGHSKKYSDLDIAIDNEEPISFLHLSQIEESLAVSNIVFKVDVTDYQTISPEFQKLIKKDFIFWA